MHQRVSRRRSMCVEALEGRYLLSREFAAVGRFLSPEVEFGTIRQPTDFPEDEPVLSPYSHSGGDLPDDDDDDPVTARTVSPAGGSRPASTTGQPGDLGDDLRSVPVDGAGLVHAGATGGNLTGPPGLPGPSHAPGFLGSSNPAGSMPSGPGLPGRLDPAVETSSVKGKHAPSTIHPIAQIAHPPVERPGLRAEEGARPRRFGMISDVMPFARDSLEQAIARIVSRLEDLGSAPTGSRRLPPSLLSPVGITIMAFLAREAYRRKLRGSGTDGAAHPLGPKGRIGRHGLPGLPGP
jgi:hypothetical protein